MKNYVNEREGQLEFLQDYLPRVDNTLTHEEIFNNYTDGVVKGNILEFKLVISDLNSVLGQAIRYLSAMRIKGTEIPKNILLISLNTETAYLYDSEEYLDKIEKVYIGASSKGIKGFSAKQYIEKIDYSNELGKQRIIEILKTDEVTKININEDCIVGWAERFYRENPKASKSAFIGDLTGKKKLVGEIRRPTYFKEYINKYDAPSNIKFQYLMDKLNDNLRKKDLGAFYTPIEYSKKSYELLYKAIENVPEGNDYVIIDRCAGTGNLQLNLPDEILSKCILSTVEYYEYKVLVELLGDKVLAIIPPIEEEDTFTDGFVRGADALTKEFLENNIIKKYVDDPKTTIILFENPPYAEVNGATREKKYKGLFKESFISKEMKNKIKGPTSNDLANVFIWSAFEYYLRQETDSYVVYAPIKYWKSQHLVNKQFGGGFAFNRKHFHAKTEAMISCILWHNISDELDNIQLEAFDLKDNKLVYEGTLDIHRVYSTFSQKYYDKREFPSDIENGITTNLNGTEKLHGTSRAKKIWNENIIGYLVANGYGFDNPRLNSGIVISNRYDSNGFILRKDNFMEKLPMLAAGKYTDHINEWKIMSNVMKSGDKSEEYHKDIKEGKLDEYLLKVLLWTSLTHYAHLRSFIGSDNRFYKNELCLDTTQGETIASEKIKKLKKNKNEIKLIEQFDKIILYAKKTDNYNKKQNYGLYQIDQELNTKQKNELTGEIIPDYPELNGEIKSLKDNVKQYYLDEIVDGLFKYSLLK